MRSIVTLLLCLALAAPAAAEGFIDLYTGGAFTDDDSGLEFDESAVLGLRGGIWGGGRLPFLGAALDISGFGSDIDDIPTDGDYLVLSHTLLLMLRAPLVTSDDFPNGQVHPYVAVGPSVVVSRVEINQPGSDFEDTETDVGIDARAGIDVILARNFGLFFEYRFLHFDSSYSDNGQRLSLDYDTQFVQGGVTFRFGGD